MYNAGGKGEDGLVLRSADGARLKVDEEFLSAKLLAKQSVRPAPTADKQVMLTKRRRLNHGIFQKRKDAILAKG